jgi:serine/threonine-protein kinase HipA
MMTSENSLEQVYVWIWLPGATEPVVAGVLSRDNGRFIFNTAAVIWSGKRR